MFSFKRRDNPEREVIKNYRWQELPPSSKPFTFDAPSGPIAAVEWGDENGVPVLLVPGITGSKEDFSLVGPALASHGYRVWSLDLAGQYQSCQAGPDADGAWTEQMHVRDMEAVLEAMGGAHYVGYSYGGILGRHLLLERPDLVRSMFFVSVPPTPGNAFTKMKVIGPLLRRGTPGVGATVLLWGINWNVNLAPRSRHDFVRHRMNYTVKDSVVGAIGDMMNVQDVNDQLAKVPVPKMVGAGSGDLWSLRHHRAHAKQIGAEFRSYRAGHAPSEATPDALARDLVQFYRKIDGGSIR